MSGELIELENLRVREGTGSSEAIASGSVQGNSDRTYECGKYKVFKIRTWVINDQPGPREQ